jgi:transposase
LRIAWALMLVSGQSAACCPLCAKPSARVHSQYSRTLQDLPWGPLRVQLHLQVRRFFCQNPACPRKIFTEPLTGLAERSARRTTRLREALLAIGWALGGQAGAWQCAAHAMPISRTTLLSLLRHWGSVARPTPRVLGVDDWTFQARSSGTLLVDLERHQPVEVLLGSDEQVLADWLLAHPGVEVIVRDRGASYLKGATKGAPQAQQVLDRWHVLKNLGEVIQKTVAQQVDVLRQASEQVQQNTRQMSLAPPACTQPESRRRKPARRKPPAISPRRAWQMAMHQQVHELAAEGKTQADIVRMLHLHPHTVRKYLRMPTFVAHYCSPYPSPVEPYRAYLEARWQQGEVMIKTLWHELQEQGFTGSYKSVWTFVRTWPLPAGMTPTSSSSSVAASTRRGAPATPTPWRVKWLLLHKPEELNAKDAAYRQAVFQLSPRLSSLSALGQDFVCMIRERKSEALHSWLERAKACPYEEVRRFAQGLEREFPAVQAALTEPWSTGQVEGQITRLKYLKRQMYGRAHIDLLRLRVLHAA